MSKMPPAPVPTRKASSRPSRKDGSVVDLERYVPAYFTWIANKLSGGASSAYLRIFDVGIETWRLLVLLAIERELTAQSISRTIGMDKASVSRAFKSMQARGLITIGLDDADGRLRVARITAEGRALHDQILKLALERERAFLEVLNASEREVLIDLGVELVGGNGVVHQAESGRLGRREAIAAQERLRRLRRPHLRQADHRDVMLPDECPEADSTRHHGFITQDQGATAEQGCSQFFDKHVKRHR